MRSSASTAARARSQRALDGRAGRPEQRGDLGGRPPEHVAQQQDGPLAIRQPLDGREEGEVQAVAARVPGERVDQRRAGVPQPRVGVGLDARSRPARPALELVEARVRGDPQQPRVHRRAALQVVERAPGAQQRLLRDVLGVGR